MKKLLLTMFMLAVTLLGGGAVLAQRQPPGMTPSMTLDQAVQQVRRTTNGRVLSAQTVTIAGRRVHRVKVLTDDGRVRTIEMSAGAALQNGGNGKIDPAIRPGLVPDDDESPKPQRPRDKDNGKDEDD